VRQGCRGRGHRARTVPRTRSGALHTRPGRLPAPPHAQVTGLPDLADTGREATGATSSAPVSATFTLTGGKTYFIRWANRNDSSSDTYAPVFTWTLTRTS